MPQIFRRAALSAKIQLSKNSRDRPLKAINLNDERSARRRSFQWNLSAADGFFCIFQKSGAIMIRRMIGIAAIAAAVALPGVVQAQGIPGGIDRGSRDGERAAGPVGAIVGGVIGGVVGGVNGVLGVDERPRFRSYVVEQRRPSYTYREDVRVGAVLPDEGVSYYDVPPEYGVRDYRYTVVNGRTVLVEPRSRRIVEIVE
jgi:hypothetical protein